MTKYLSVLPNQLESVENHITKKHDICVTNVYVWSRYDGAIITLRMIQAFKSNLGKDPY